MSISTTSTVEGVAQRRAQIEDVTSFNTLLNASGGPALFRATFGQYNYPMMIENSCVCLISVTEEQEKCLGLFVINDSPTVSVETDTFLNTVASIQPYIPGVNPNNTLFLNFFLVDETSRFDSDAISTDLVRNAFTLSPSTDFIVWVCPAKVKLGFWMEDNFVTVPTHSASGSSSASGTAEEEKKDGGDGKRAEGAGGADTDALLTGGTVRLLYLSRSAFMPKLLVRTARVEDNDDLLPILRHSNPQIVEGQSAFFLADLIQTQDDRNRFLVGVNDNIPVGMLATSLDVNVALITKIFDLERYPDIVRAKEKRPPPPPIVVLVLGDIRAMKTSSMRDLVVSMNSVFIDAEELLGPPSSGASSSGEEKGSGAGDDREEEEARYAQVAIDTLKDHISLAIANHSSKTPPTACFVTGFPRTDTEAHQISLGYMHFDIMAELCDESDKDAAAAVAAAAAANAAAGEDVAVEEADGNYFRAHIESVEVLRNFMGSGRSQGSTTWYSVPLGEGGGTIEKDFYASAKSIVDQRAKEVKEILDAEEEEPPLANAFAVTVFCTDLKFATRGDDLLRVAFEDNPSLDYCLYMMSNAAAPTLLTSSMSLVKLRPGVSFDQCLFVIRRETLLAYELLQVTRLEEAHMSSVESFLAPLKDDKDRIVKACIESNKLSDVELKDNPPDACFAVMMKSDVVGIVSISRRHLNNDDITWLRSNFQLDDVVNYDRHRLRAQAQITNFVVHPVYSKWTRLILRETMRKSFKTLLYFQSISDATPPVEVMDEFYPVAPRRRMQASPSTALPMIEKPTANGATVASPLFFLTKRRISEIKMTVTKRVVIIGGGSSSYALLEKLLFVPHLNFPNLLLVTELPPIAFQTKADSAELAFSTRCTGVLSCDDADDPSPHELSALGMAHRLSITRGRLTDIDRENKAIVISDEIVSEFDVLVIAAATRDCSTKKFPTTAGIHPVHCAFRGMFGLGDAVSDTAALSWVQRQSRDRQAIVVFGEGLECVGAVGALLQQGIEAYRITVVMHSEKAAEIVHPLIMESAVRNLKVCGVNLRFGYDLADVQLTKFGGIESVLLKKLEKPAVTEEEAELPVPGAEEVEEEPDTLVLPCFSLLCCNTKYCDSDVFTAINDCGIVFDGGVVVDNNFCTNDSSIYAVGSFSRFSRLFRDEPLHNKHSSRELGLYVASRILERNLDPQSPHVIFGETAKTPRTNSLSVSPKSLPKFRFPKTISMPMPNGRFVFVSQLASAASANEPGLLVTGDLSADRISALKIDSLGMLIEMAYLGKAEVEAKNLGKLVGWHESFLNGAVYSYQEGMVDDWVGYFRADWATALYHDNFAELADTLRSSLELDKNAFTIVDLMLDAGDRSMDDNEVLAERRRVLGPRAEKLPPNTYKLIEQQTIEHLRRHKVLLPRFHLPALKAKK